MDEANIWKLLNNPGFLASGGLFMAFGYFALRVVKDIVFKAFDSKKSGVSPESLERIFRTQGAHTVLLESIERQAIKTNGTLSDHGVRIRDLEQA